MLNRRFVSVYLALWLIAFFAVNIRNVVQGRLVRAGKATNAEVGRPWGLSMLFASFGTGMFFFEELLFILASFLGFPFFNDSSILGNASNIVQTMGLILVGSGFFLFLWSVIERGQNSVSWEMTEDHCLVTTGPYGLVRHPSYLGYFLMFTGFLLTVQNTVALLPLAAIPGYVMIVGDEEEMLTLMFGDVYREYMDRTGRFIPKLSG